MASVVGKTIFSDGKGKLFFGYYKDNDAVEFVDYKTWKKLNFKDVSKGDTNKQAVIKAIVRNQKQFNKKVDFNMWSKKQKRSFEDTMDWFIKNGWISNITKRGIKEGIEDVLSVREDRNSNMFYVLYQKKGVFGKPAAAGYKNRKDAEKFAKSLGNNHNTMILDKQSMKNVKGVDVKESVNESASKEAMGIAALTGTRGSAVQDFIDKNRINSKKLFRALKSANLQGRLNFASALAGKPGNPNAKLTIKLFGEASLSQIHKAAKKGSYPVTVIASVSGKIVKQELVSTPQAVPAVFKSIQSSNPKAKISVEDKTGKVLFMESKQDVIKLKKKSKSETAFYDILSTMEKKYGSRGFEKWLDKSLKDMGVNPRKFNTSAEKQEALYQSTLKEDLRNWFKSKWVNIGKKDKSGKHPPCGTSGKKRGYAKCVPAAKAATMSKKEKESATRRKRAAQNKSNRGGKSSAGQGKKPINVSTHTGGRKSGTGKGS